ncbi:MAG: phosphoglycerate mutase [Planctomyces sp.]|nr:phosphoglycerate mutase [Planctomyces sp.]
MAAPAQSHVVIIADGASDQPLAELGGRTPLEAAQTPALDALARRGAVGTAGTTPPGWQAGSDVCSMCLLGYDPREYHTGRAPLEAAAIGLDPPAGAHLYRVNLVSVGEPGTPDEGLMLDHSAGAISDAEARELFEALARAWGAAVPGVWGRSELRHGVSYRGVWANWSGLAHGEVVTTPPHEVPGKPWRHHAPTARNTGEAALEAERVLGAMVAASAAALPGHPVNAARRAAGKRPANLAWPWGQGTRPSMPGFQGRFGVRGAMTTAVDLLAGIAHLIGWTRLRVPGVTSYHDNDYAAQGRATVEALADHGVVCCHVEAPDEASHQGDWRTKVAAIEAIDRHVVGPIVRSLERDRPGRWRVMVLPDHATLVSTRRHHDAPVPVLIAGAGVAPGRAARLTEAQAALGGWHVPQGHTLMDVLLRAPAVPPAATPGPASAGEP